MTFDFLVGWHEHGVLVMKKLGEVTCHFVNNLYVFLGILHPLHTEQKASPHHPLHPAHEAQPHPLFHQLQRDCTQVREHRDSSRGYFQLSARVASVFTLRLSSSGFSCWCSCLVESMPLSSRPASLLVTGRRRWRNSNKERSSCECLCKLLTKSTFLLLLVLWVDICYSN